MLHPEASIKYEEEIKSKKMNNKGSIIMVFGYDINISKFGFECGSLVPIAPVDTVLSRF